MSAGVVDPLEPVKVDEEDREAGRESLGPDQELVQPVEHEIAVGQARQRVVGGDVLQGALGVLEFIDLSRDPQQPHDIARRVVERRLGGQGPVDLAALELAALRQADERLVRLHDPRVVQHGPLAELLAEKLDVGLPDELRRIRVSEVQCHLPAHAQQPSLAILEVDAVDQRFHQGTEEEVIVQRNGRRHRDHPLASLDPGFPLRE